MAQLLERAKTFFIMLTKNDNIEMLDEDNIEKAVAEIRAQESGNIGKLEKNVQDVNISLEDEPIVKKVKINERIAREQADSKVKVSKEKDVQREN